MKELVKPVLNDEEEVVVQALCEQNSCWLGSCGNSSVEEEDEIIF
jgi:hypothetical protein